MVVWTCFSGKLKSLGRQEREALVASTPKVGRSPPGRMGTKAGIPKQIGHRRSVHPVETISSIFKSYQHRSWKMPDNQFNQHSNIFNQHSNIFQHIPRYSKIFQDIPTSSNIFQHLPTSSNRFQHIPTDHEDLFNHTTKAGQFFSFAGDRAPAAPPAKGCLWQRVGHSAMKQTVSKCLETYRLYRLYENAKVIKHIKMVPKSFFYGNIIQKIHRNPIFPICFPCTSRDDSHSRLQVDLSPASDGAGPYFNGGPRKLTSSRSAMRPWEMWRMVYPWCSTVSSTVSSTVRPSPSSFTIHIFLNWNRRLWYPAEAAISTNSSKMIKPMKHRVERFRASSVTKSPVTFPRGFAWISSGLQKLLYL